MSEAPHASRPEFLRAIHPQRSIAKSVATLRE